MKTQRFLTFLWCVCEKCFLPVIVAKNCGCGKNCRFFPGRSKRKKNLFYIQSKKGKNDGPFIVHTVTSIPTHLVSNWPSWFEECPYFSNFLGKWLPDLENSTFPTLSIKSKEHNKTLNLLSEKIKRRKLILMCFGLNGIEFKIKPCFWHYQSNATYQTWSLSRETNLS